MSFGYQRRRPLTEEEKSSDVAKARARALETLAAQEVSSGQLYERLCRRFTEQAAAEVVAEMVQREYVNDERYAAARAHSLLAGAFCCRGAGGEPLPPKACHGSARLGRGGPAAARLCVCGRQRSHQESGRRITPN